MESIFVSWAPTNISASGGVVNTVFSDDIASANDYASFAAIWDEYRVLQMEVHYVPFNRYNLQLSNVDVIGPCFVLVDRDDGTATASMALASNYESADLKSLCDPFKKRVNMASVEDAQFTTTTTTVARNWIKLYGTGFTSSVVFGTIHQFALVQFRGRN
jgi:hypothetical protein